MTDYKVDLLFKEKFNRGFTSDSKKTIYETNQSTNRRTFPTDVWLEYHEIPNPAPVLLNNQYSADLLVQYREKVAFSKIDTKAFYNEEFKDAVQSNYDTSTGSYTYKLYGDSDEPIYYGQGNWIADRESGIIAFIGDLPTSITTNIWVSFYKYTGPKLGNTFANYKITQASHGFAIGDVIELSAGGVYSKALASLTSTPENTKPIGVIYRVIDANNAVLITRGYLRAPSHGLTLGAQLYLSSVTPGAVTETYDSNYMVIKVGSIIDADVIEIDISSAQNLSFDKVINSTNTDESYSIYRSDATANATLSLDLSSNNPAVNTVTVKATSMNIVMDNEIYTQGTNASNLRIYSGAVSNPHVNFTNSTTFTEADYSSGAVRYSGDVSIDAYQQSKGLYINDTTTGQPFMRYYSGTDYVTYQMDATNGSVKILTNNPLQFTTCIQIQAGSLIEIGGATLSTLGNLSYVDLPNGATSGCAFTFFGTPKTRTGTTFDGCVYYSADVGSAGTTAAIDLSYTRLSLGGSTAGGLTITSPIVPLDTSTDNLQKQSLISLTPQFANKEDMFCVKFQRYPGDPADNFGGTLRIWGFVIGEPKELV